MLKITTYIIVFKKPNLDILENQLVFLKIDKHREGIKDLS